MRICIIHIFILYNGVQRNYNLFPLSLSLVITFNLIFFNRVQFSNGKWLSTQGIIIVSYNCMLFQIYISFNKGV